MAALTRSSERIATVEATPRPQGRSLFGIAPGLILLAIAIADCARFADTDLWGHLFFGGMLWHRGPHLGPDPFSYAPHYPHWLHHEWLSEVLMAWIYASTGIMGLKLWKLACTAATIGLVALAEGDSDAPLGLQFIVLTASSFALVPYIQFRPLLFSYAFTAATIVLITRDNFGKRSPLWILIPGLTLWANLHGSFFIGLALLGTYTAIRGLTDLLRGESPRGLRRLVSVTAASAVASLATPYGLDSWRAVLISIRNPMTRQVMADWRPLVTVLGEQMREAHGGTIFLWCALALLGLFAVVTVLTLRFDDLALVAIATLLSIGAVMAVRNVPLALVAIAPVLTRHLQLLIRDGIGWRAKEVSPSGGEPTRPGRLAQGIVAGLAVLILVQTGFFGSRLQAANRYPKGAVAFMKAHGLRGNILNYFAWGQYLIWHCSPDAKIFIDGRYDLVYPPNIIREYMAFFDRKPGGAELLNRYPHDFVLMPPKGPVSATMASRRDWKLVYQDTTAQLYARANSPLPAAPAVPAVEPQGPSVFP